MVRLVQIAFLTALMILAAADPADLHADRPASTVVAAPLR